MPEATMEKTVIKSIVLVDVNKIYTRNPHSRIMQTACVFVIFRRAMGSVYLISVMILWVMA